MYTVDIIFVANIANNNNILLTNVRGLAILGTVKHSYTEKIKLKRDL